VEFHEGPSVRRKEAHMTDRNTLEEDLDGVLVGLAPEPVGEWDWEPPLGSAIPASPAVSTEPSEPEDTDESEDESDQQQDYEDDA
jgi:hypothetical protein